ncbi:MAG: beta galactosidase jelly roll domain-containing protein [Candidatus Borkfalkiaceae bacterium]|nr:beta galactosidase jelly roll domain-containing protein [Christensenellaceae bacterium]
MKHAQCYKSGYPRPKFVRDSFLSLDGKCEFAFDYDNNLDYSSGKKQLPLEINLPFAYNTESSGINEEKDCETVWYRKQFAFKKSRGKRVFINFDGADYFTKVWLNGKYLGTHEGGYDRFTFEITKEIKENNVLVVCCVDPFDPAYPKGKQRHLDHNTGCFYKPTVGIWKTVWIEETGENKIDWVYPETEYSECRAIVHYEVDKAEKGTFLSAEVYFNGNKVAETETEILNKEGKILIDLENRKEQLPMKPWSAGVPQQFFDVKYRLKKNGKVIDEVGSYFALVSYTTDKDRILINYLPATYLRMVLNQGYYVGGDLTGTEEQIYNDVCLIKEMGFNGVRMHQKIEDERFYYYCDMMGLYVWCEMPSAYVTDDRTVTALLTQWASIVKQIRGFASVMAYVPFNESWGALQVKENERQQNFVNAAYFVTKTLVPDRLAVGNDGWEHTFTDLLTVHNYSQDKESLYEAYSDTEGFTAGERVKDLHTRSAFSDGYGYDGQPIILSEFGGVKYSPDDTSWGYGNAANTEKELENRIAGLVKATAENKKIAGYCYTQFTDVYQEKNGLLTFDRKPKISLEKIKHINEIY